MTCFFDPAACMTSQFALSLRERPGLLFAETYKRKSSARTRVIDRATTDAAMSAELCVRRYSAQFVKEKDFFAGDLMKNVEVHD